MAEPEVYFAQIPEKGGPEGRGKATETILKASGLDGLVECHDKVGVKVHVG